MRRTRRFKKLNEKQGEPGGGNAVFSEKRHRRYYQTRIIPVHVRHDVSYYYVYDGEICNINIIIISRQ